jgi:glycosyltransferase involved in cell wall biosynthesis
VQRLDSTVRLNIVGRRPEAGLRELVKNVDGIELTGEVDDVLPFLRRAGAVVVPLRIGGGTRIKILEAMAAGKVVVSTTIGAEGLAVEDGRHLLLADTPQDFAAASIKALDRSVAAAIGPRARALVEEQYSWKLQAENLERYWAEAVSAKR